MERTIQSSIGSGSATIDLAGQWAIYLDPDDRGIHEAWYSGSSRAAQPSPASQAIDGNIELPGCLQSQGYGDAVGIDTEWVGAQFDKSFYTDPRFEPYRSAENFRFPYWLQPERRYIGAAWYLREIEIPEEWRGMRVALKLERPHWSTSVWLDDRYLGSNDSLSVAHQYCLGIDLPPGRYRLSIRVDNRLLVDVGENAHSVSDHTQGNWNGIVGAIELAATSPVRISNTWIVPSLERHSLMLSVTVSNDTEDVVAVALAADSESERTGDGRENTRAQGRERQEQLEIQPGTATLYREILIDRTVAAWDEFTPELVNVEVALQALVAGASYTDCRRLRTGLREVGTTESAVTVNGRPVFLRGTLECCVFPRTGYPPTDSEAWREIYRQAKAYGLNHIRFHSWCPPEAAFDAADEEGIYLQVEGPVWANFGAQVGTGKPLDEWLYRETERILEAYGNHPSFVMMAHGNEPDGRTEEYLGLWLTHWQSRDSRRIYTSGAGWPAIPENDYHNVPEPRIQAWGQGLSSRINARPPETQTDYRDTIARYDGVVVSHEIGQWCVFPNFAEMHKYTGPLKPKNFEIFRDLLSRNGMAEQAEAFLHASGRQQLLCYKEEIESALRTPGFGGFQLLGLTDFPGQGSALVGVLDSFWEEKGYTDAQEFREFCGPSTVLARMAARTFRSSDTLEVDVEVAHYGPEPIPFERAAWRLVAKSGQVSLSGELHVSGAIGVGLTSIGKIRAPLHELPAPEQYQLIVELLPGSSPGPGANRGRNPGPSDTAVRNRWDIWLYPETLPEQPMAELTVTETLDEEAERVLDAGGTVLVLPDASRIASDVEIGFSSVFWNTAWTQGQAPHTLGLLCDPDHPVFEQFPTESHSNWQWWELVHGSAAMVLDQLPHELKPIVQPIDTWFRSHKLGLLIEAKVGNGNVVLCSMDIEHALERRIVARQFRQSLLSYLASNAFRPEVRLEIGVLRQLFKSATP